MLRPHLHINRVFLQRLSSFTITNLLWHTYASVTLKRGEHTELFQCSGLVEHRVTGNSCNICNNSTGKRILIFQNFVVLVHYLRQLFYNFRVELKYPPQILYFISLITIYTKPSHCQLQSQYDLNCEVESLTYFSSCISVLLASFSAQISQLTFAPHGFSIFGSDQVYRALLEL